MSSRLTAAELRVLEQAARGLSCKTSAVETHHTEQTIKFHRHNIITKLDARNITHAVAIALRDGLLVLGDDRAVGHA